MGWHEQNIQTYNQSAEALAEYFKGAGPRTIEIEKALKLARAAHGAHVIEIGCGDGRDAEVIVPRVASYEGVDPSEKLLEIARRRLPGVSFVLADAISYEYPNDIDVIYAIASMLHVDKEGIVKVFEKSAASLKEGGIFYLIVKQKPEYTTEVQKDKFGERTFFYYTPTLLEELSQPWFDVVYEDHDIKGRTHWLSLALQKKSTGN